jgi:proline iminopeptidase
VIALDYAARYPDRVDGLVLVSAPGTDTSFVSSSEAIMRSRLTTFDRGSIRYWLSRRQLDSTRADAELWRLNHKAYMHDPAAVKNVMREPEGYVPAVHDQLMHAFLGQRDLRRRIKQYRGPSLLIYGSDDIYDRRTIDRLNSDLARSRVIFIENAGHFPWVEDRDVFYAAIRDELSRVR